MSIHRTDDFTSAEPTTSLHDWIEYYAPARAIPPAEEVETVATGSANILAQMYAYYDA